MSLKLRPVRPEDAPGILEIYGPIVQDTPTSFEFAPPHAVEIEYRIRRAISTHPWLVCEESDTGRIAGYAYSGVFRTRRAYQWSTEVSVYVHPDFHRRGIARTLYRALFDVLAQMGFVRVFAGITLPNEPSVRLHESVGFEAVGVLERVGYKFDRWHDVGWWQRDLEGVSEHPERDPEAFPRVRNHPAVVQALSAAEAGLR